MENNTPLNDMELAELEMIPDARVHRLVAEVLTLRKQCCVEELDRWDNCTVHNTQCCERDTDHDGNCDRHPSKVYDDRHPPETSK